MHVAEEGYGFERAHETELRERKTLICRRVKSVLPQANEEGGKDCTLHSAAVEVAAKEAEIKEEGSKSFICEYL